MDNLMNDQSLPEGPTISAEAVGKPTRIRGNGCLAVSGNFLLPGLGHALVGSPQRGLMWMGAAVMAVLVEVIASRRGMIIPFVAVAIFDLLVRLLSLPDGYLAARRSSQSVVARTWQRVILGAGLLVFACWLQWPRQVVEKLILPHLEAFSVSSQAMTPSLLPHDRILVDKGSKPERWDVVAYRYPSRGRDVTYVSRVAGLPGETVEIQAVGLAINGQIVKLPVGVQRYVSLRKSGLEVPLARGEPGNGTQGYPITLDKDEYFLLSDNTVGAVDSRLWEIQLDGHQAGALPARCIVGVVRGIYWPLARWRAMKQ